MRTFPNRQACLRLVSALAVEASEECMTGRRYLDMRGLKEHWYREREAKEAMLMERWRKNKPWRKLQYRNFRI